MLKVVVAASNQEKALVVRDYTNLRMELFEALINTIPPTEFHGSFVTSRSHFCVLSDSYQTSPVYFSGHKSPLTMCEDTDL